MKNTISVLEGIRKHIADNINNYLDNNNPFNIVVPKITDKQVVVDFPDIDSLPFSNMIYIVDDYTEISPQTTCTNLVNKNVKVYIFCRRDKNDNLIRRVSTYFNAVAQICIRDTTLGNTVNLCEMTSADFYPSCTADNSIAAYELNIVLRYIFQV